MSTTTNLNTLKINYLTQAQYDAALENNEINENELYLTPSDGNLLVEEVLLADNITINGETYGNGSASVSKAGFTPIGIVGMHLQNAFSKVKMKQFVLWQTRFWKQIIIVIAMTLLVM